MSVKLLQKHIFATFEIESPQRFKQKAMNWASQFEVACLLDNNQYPAYLHHSHELLLAVGGGEELVHQVGLGQETAFEKLKSWAAEQDGWLFGFLGYDLKNEAEQLDSLHFDGVGFPDLHFFRPRHVLEWKGKQLKIYSEENPREIFEKISAQAYFQPASFATAISVQPRI